MEATGKQTKKIIQENMKRDMGYKQGHNGNAILKIHIGGTEELD